MSDTAHWLAHLRNMQNNLTAVAKRSEGADRTEALEKRKIYDFALEHWEKTKKRSTLKEYSDAGFK